MKKRAILIVLDSVGIGELPDADEFHDNGAHTLGNIYKSMGGLNIPNLQKLGISNIENARLGSYSGKIQGCYGKAKEITKAKDTTSGHWEMCGVVMENAFKTYPDGFPNEIIKEFEKRTGHGVIGNIVASGTEIIKILGDEHMKTGKVIVYTSADSVFQIAAHEQVVPLEELYNMCSIAREMLVGDNLVGRVIARPFIGENGNYTRTENRRDYAVPPIKTTILDSLSDEGYTTVAVGKIEDIFANRGISVSDHTRNNHDGIEATIKFIKDGTGDFIFTNLVDFDMLYGHRNDVEGYAKAIEYFDLKLPEIIDSMTDDDLLIITADHGCDPTYPGTDHTREHIPILAYSKKMKSNVNIGTRDTFADIGATIYEYIAGKDFGTGKSFLCEIE